MVFEINGIYDSIEFGHQEPRGYIIRNVSVHFKRIYNVLQS